MFRPTLVVFALVAVATAERSFINKCSLSAPDINKCFVENANLAIEVLHYGLEDLDLPSMEGFDIGDVFFSLGEDLSFLLEDAKSYPVGIKLEDARVTFGIDKQLKKLVLFFIVTDVTWQVKYRALGFTDNRKIKETGYGQINLGEFKGNFTMDFKPIEVDGVTYLKIKKNRAAIENEKFQFVPRDVKAVGEPLHPEQFNQLEKAVVDKAHQVCVDIVTFSFDQILEEIPANEIFLP